MKKAVSVKVPVDLWQDYRRVADARGIDLTSLVVWALAEYRPRLLAEHAQYMADLEAARGAGGAREVA